LYETVGENHTDDFTLAIRRIHKKGNDKSSFKFLISYMLMSTQCSMLACKCGGTATLDLWSAYVLNIDVVVYFMGR
jgi:hypothetical protein